QPGTGSARGDLVTVDAIQVGDLPDRPQQALDPPAILGDEIALLGAGWQDGGGARLDPAALTLHAGDALHLQLTWQAQDWPAVDYTAFVHLVGPDGGLAAQVDYPPLDGSLPTSTWVPGQRVVDTFVLAIPTDAPPGDYQLMTGFYDSATVTRLPVRQGDTALGDAFTLAAIRVQSP